MVESELWTLSLGIKHYLLLNIAGVFQAMEYSRSIRDKRGKGNLFAVEDGEEGSMGDILPVRQGTY